MTPPDTDHRARDRFDSPDLYGEPVQGTASRVYCGMADHVMDQTREGSEKVGTPDPIPESDGRFGDEAVPLRPATERDAEAEREAVLRLVAAVSPGESLLRRHHRTVALSLAFLALVAVAATQIGGGGDGPDQQSDPGATSAAEEPPPIPAGANPAGPALAIANADSVSGSQQLSHRQASPRRRRHPKDHRERQDDPARQAAAATAVPEPTATPEPEPEPQLEPAPSPAPEPAPEPEPAPAPQQTQPSTSTPSNQTVEQSQVESQFGFEQ